MLDKTNSFSARIIVNIGVLFSLLIHFHGEESAGGGFQGGAILASSIILYEIIFYLPKKIKRQLVPTLNLEFLSFVGILFYFACGMISLMNGGEFLNYETFQIPSIISQSTAQKIGITVAETGVFLVVSTTLIRIWYAFSRFLH